MSEREEYTPDLGSIRAWYAGAVDEYQCDTGMSADEAEAAFDRAIAAHDRKVRQQIAREQATVHVLTSERNAALVRNGDLIARHDAACEEAWQQGYDTGRRDYAGSITGGAPISTPNPHTARIARGEDQTDE